MDTYVNASGQLRMGTLFQDLDALAGVISYKVSILNKSNLLIPHQGTLELINKTT